MPDPLLQSSPPARGTLILALAASVLGAAAWMHPEVDGSDLWWHMAAGRWVVKQGYVPLHDVFTHTAFGQPWADHEWLWGVLAWLAYDLDPDFLAWMNLAVATAIFLLVALRAYELSGSWLAACLATWMAAAASHWYIDVRPHLITLLFTAVLLATFRFRFARWIWAPLLALWVNLHGGFIFGVGLVGLSVLIASGRAWRAGDAIPVRDWIFVVATLLALGLNPWGFAMVLEPFEHLRSSTPFSALLEWVPLEWSIDPRNYAGRFFWLGAIALLGLRRVRDPYALILVLLTVLMTTRARRFVPLFAVVSAPLAAAGLATLFERMRQLLGKRSARLPGWAGPLGAALLLGLGLAQWSGVRFTPEPLKRWTLLDGVPTGAVAYLAAMENPPQRLFNTYRWGGYLSFVLPQGKIFIDGRAATLYSDELVADYHTLIDAGPGWPDLVRKYQLDAVLVENPSPLAAALMAELPSWQRVGVDPRNQLLFAPGRGELRTPIQVIGRTADLHLSRAFSFRTARQLDRAEHEVAEALRLEPLQVLAYGEGMMVAALRSDPERVQAFVDRALVAYPRRRDLIFSLAERAWRTLGDPERQREALKSIRLGGPFVTPESREQIATLTDRLDADLRSGTRL